MKVLFITANLYPPQAYGGSQTSTHQLCHGLMRRGHHVAVLTGLISGLIPESVLGLAARISIQINQRFSGCKVSRDTGLGYPVWRIWCPWEVVEYVAKREKPDLIVVLAFKPVRMALAAKRTGTPILMQLQDVDFGQHDGDFSALGGIPCIANSHFTANTYRRAYGVDPEVIYPFISLERYRTRTSRESVTFINPIPKKGSDIALELARLCPEIPFTFIEGWRLSFEERQPLTQKLFDLPNLKLLASQSDMRKVYQRCKILLTPSICEESYGMVVTEAQASGIPAVASARGGLRESVGPGGILLDPDGPIDDWVKSIRRLWNDDQSYAGLSAAASAYAQRPEMALSYQIDAYERAFLSACGR